MSALGNIKVRTLRDVAYESIKESILRHEFMPGESITITNLSEKLGISPTPVREAVVRLSNEGILDYEANKRIKVSQINRRDVSEVYEARGVLEIYISRKIVQRLRKNQVLSKKLAKLKAETDDLLKKDEDPKHYASIDLKLHELFLDMLGNEILKELFYILGNKSLRIRTFVEAINQDSSTSGAALQNSAHEHLAIIEALLEGDEDRVVAAVETHLCNSETRTLKYLENYFKTL